MISTIAAAARDQRRRRMLLPISTLLAAVAIAGVSGATFNESTANPLNSFSTGSFSQLNSKDDAHIFSASNLKPGDTVIGDVTLTNDGTIALEMTLSADDAVNGFEDDSNLQLTIEEGSTEIWSGDFGAMPAQDLGEWAALESHTYTFTVALDEEADMTEQGKTATATFEWDAVQLDGVEIDQR